MQNGDLKIWRKEMGWSQAKLARELGVARETVVRWEHGSTVGSERMLALACAKLAEQLTNP